MNVWVDGLIMLALFLWAAVATAMLHLRAHEDREMGWDKRRRELREQHTREMNRWRY